MSFGVGVGDFLAIWELLGQIHKRFVDAPGQFKAVSNEVTSLSNILRDIECVLSQLVLTDWQKKALISLLEECRSVLITLGKVVDENYYLNPSDSHGLRNKSRRMWKILKWEPDNIQELRLRVALNVCLLNAFNGSLMSKIILEIKEEEYRRSKRQDRTERNKEDQAILDWLTPIDYATRQQDIISSRQAGTGQWLLDSAEFQTWLNTNKQTLFCTGIPGAGKTVLTSVVVEELNTRFQNDKDIAIVYLYCNFRRKNEQKAIDLLTSLLKQLTQDRPSLPDSVQSLYDSHKKKRTQPSFNEILRTLKSVAIMYSRIFIIVDALDECQVSDNCRSVFLDEIFSLQAKCQASLFATSRFIPEINERFKESLQLEIRASNQDVLTFLDGNMWRLPKFVLLSSELQSEVKAKIIESVDGMFLLAELYLDSLKRKKTPKAIYTTLSKLSTGSDAYDNAYKEAMERIESQLEDKDLAKQVLSWITCARPLSMSELQHAVGIEIGEPQLDKKNLCPVEDFVSVCEGLVVVDKESGIVRLVHYTAQKYFDRTRSYWFPNVETDITKTCLTCLLFDEFESGFCQSDEEFEERLRSNRLYDYASNHWGYHARAASMAVEHMILDFLKNEAKVSSSSQAMMALKRGSWNPGYSQRVPRQIIGLHLAAHFGLRQMVTRLLEDGYDPDTKDTDGNTPLQWAVVTGRIAVVELLLDDDNVDVNSEDVLFHDTPLSTAARIGDEVAVKVLLAKERIDVNCTDVLGYTPLSNAASEGHEKVVNVLLMNDNVDFEARDKLLGRTPLHLAAEAGHEAIVKLLIIKGRIDLDSKDKSGRTPLILAAAHGHGAVVELLLKSDVDPDSKDDDERTPLSWAAEKGHDLIVKLLLDKTGVDPNCRDTRCGGTPLSWVARSHSWDINMGHENAMKLLLETDGVDPNSKDNDGRTPLSVAAANGHEALVALLLADDKVDFNSKDKWDYRSPLSLAAEWGHDAVVNLLLAKDGLDPDSKDKYGRTPLSWAAANGREAVMNLLLENIEVTQDSKDNDGRTPLSWAASEGRETIVKLLLAKDSIDPDSEDKHGLTPLWWAAENWHEAVVRELLANDSVQPNSECKTKVDALYMLHISTREKVFCKGALLLQKNDDLDVEEILDSSHDCRYCHCIIGDAFDRFWVKSHVPFNDGVDRWARFKCLICHDSQQLKYDWNLKHFKTHLTDGTSLCLDPRVIRFGISRLRKKSECPNQPDCSFIHA